MPATNPRNMIVGLDVGTSKIVIFLGEVKVDGHIEIISKAEEYSDGLRNGMIVNIESTQKGIHKALKNAELMIGETIHSVSVGVVGSHINSRDSKGMVAISHNEVSASDIQRVLESAKTVALEKDQQILHLIPKEYIIDEQPGILKPVGMSGVRLEAKVHLVTCAESALQNLKKCVERCGVEVRSFVLLPLASSHSVLLEDEKELGVVVVDIGAGTTDIALFVNGAITYTAVVPIAGHDVTRDIALMLRTPQSDAEQLKLQYGCAYGPIADANLMVEVRGVGGRQPTQISLGDLTPVIQSRYEELFRAVREKIYASSYNESHLRAGLVLTGGAASIDGLEQLASEYLGIPVRIGYPTGVDSVVSDAYELKYASGIGLIRYINECSPTLQVQVSASDQKHKTQSKPREGAFSWLKKVSDKFL